jgi:Arc/MetJ-type ribon-helix-helix transcriptional regulator
MAIQITIPNDLGALVQKRLASGSFASAEEVLRTALEAQDAEENWTN